MCLVMLRKGKKSTYINSLLNQLGYKLNISKAKLQRFPGPNRILFFSQFLAQRLEEDLRHACWRASIIFNTWLPFLDIKWLSSCHYFPASRKEERREAIRLKKVFSKMLPLCGIYSFYSQSNWVCGHLPQRKLKNAFFKGFLGSELKGEEGFSKPLNGD